MRKIVSIMLLVSLLSSTGWGGGIVVRNDTLPEPPSRPVPTSNDSSWGLSSFTSFFSLNKRGPIQGISNKCTASFKSRSSKYTLTDENLQEPQTNITDIYIPSEGIDVEHLGKLPLFKIPDIDLAVLEDCSRMTLSQMVYLIKNQKIGILTDKCLFSVPLPIYHNLSPFLIQRLADQKPAVILENWTVFPPRSLVQTSLLSSSILKKEDHAGLCCYFKPSDFQYYNILFNSSGKCLRNIFAGKEKCLDLEVSFFSDKATAIPPGDYLGDERNATTGPAWLFSNMTSEETKEILMKKIPSTGISTSSEDSQTCVFRIISSMDISCFDALSDGAKVLIWKKYGSSFEVGNFDIYERRKEYMESLMTKYERPPGIAEDKTPKASAGSDSSISYQYSCFSAILLFGAFFI